MEIEDIIRQIKDRGDVIKKPVRLRRKPKEPRPRKRVGRDRVKHAAISKRWMRTIDGAYTHMANAYRARAKRRAARGTKAVEWNLTRDEWRRLWRAAGYISLPGGVEIRAFALRPQQVRMWRIDDNQPWKLDNIVIMYEGRAIADGRKL